MKISKERHAQQIRDQFTKQAVPFAQLKGHTNSIQSLIEMSACGAEDRVLDVACGPGMVACEFAQVAAEVYGIDLTDRMIEAARKRQASQGLKNLYWQVGAAEDLPYADASFSVVVSRYTFHHFMDPAAVLSEMCRVCRPGGRVVVADPVLPSSKLAAFNAMERLRDPSHVAALSCEAFERMIRNAGLKQVKFAQYVVEVDLEAQLAASFPNPGDADRIRALFERDLREDRMGVNARRDGEAIRYAYPIAIYSGVC
ncbi:methyltransferase domain-containing protein [Coraliomargarita algicola]|uniref:Methyltransferase domain-containing protein n=1 Tax=Coraliomargarita algicola TaxID=3092156 RepID=A0ABZ0RIR8_9BACT|nr:methyltransferase domain-containing protein [Coraliomargarita sp. J2-16]WPJ94685.1 methyltransferase domain-containing protein [Coraliomargarita sp. J2-16]